MRNFIMAIVLILATATASFAIGDIGIGPYVGMAFPVINDAAKSGMMYGLQSKVALVSFVSAGLHYSSRAYGNPTQTIFEGTQYEFVDEFDGGSVSSFGADLCLGKQGGSPGFGVYFASGISTFSWTRDNEDDVSESAWLVGFGVEYVLPMKLSVETKSMIEVASTGKNSTYKAVLWHVGVNYYISLIPTQMGR